MSSWTVDELQFLEWADDDEQDHKILLDFFDAFPGIPSPEELEILKRKANELFPPAKVPEAKPFRKRRKAGMLWTNQTVQKVTSRAEALGLPPWELVGIRKKAGKLVCEDYESRQPNLHKKG